MKIRTYVNKDKRIVTAVLTIKGDSIEDVSSYLRPVIGKMPNRLVAHAKCAPQDKFAPVLGAILATTRVKNLFYEVLAWKVIDYLSERELDLPEIEEHFREFYDIGELIEVSKNK